MPKQGKSGWAALDDGDFFQSELLILSDDGDTALFVPMEEPREELDKSFSKEGRKVAVVAVVRVGDAEIDDPVAWYLQEYKLGVRAARVYRKCAEGHEGKRIVRVTRHGEANSQKTRYLFTVERELSDADAAACRKLYDESRK